MNIGKLAFPVFVLAFLSGCSAKKKIPDVSGIHVPLATVRFEKDFFSIDTSHLDASLQNLHKQQPGFTQDFLFNILGSSPDSSEKNVPAFINSYMDMYQASLQTFKDLSPVEKEVKKGLQFVHFYFPAYQLPSRLVTFIGPINSYGNIITPDALAVGLQLYMGKEYPLYQTEQGQQLYPFYLSRRFEAAYIPVNCMKNIIDDMYPNHTLGKPLVEQMIESGKRLYLLNQFLPETADTLTTGYTKSQLAYCNSNERNIWSFFIQNDFLYNPDPNLTRDYLTDGPYTQALGEQSPANIGQFAGYRIVNKWMEKNKDISLTILMETPARKIFEESKYKP